MRYRCYSDGSFRGTCGARSAGDKRIIIRVTVALSFWKESPVSEVKLWFLSNMTHTSALVSFSCALTRRVLRVVAMVTLILNGVRWTTRLFFFFFAFSCTSCPVLPVPFDKHFRMF